jgi:Cd2+/Zn2+-exporting ATPase
MLEENRAACEVCEEERARREAVGFGQKYAIGLFSAVLLTIGLVITLPGGNRPLNYVLFMASLLASGRWTIPDGFRDLWKKHLGTSFLMTVAASGAMIIGEPAEGATVMLLFYIAELLEEKAGARMKSEIGTLVELEPPTVVAKNDAGFEVRLSPDDVYIGQIMIVRPGERIGLDGVVVRGASTVNQAPITGESNPVEKNEGDQVYAGTVNLDGYLEVEVTKLSHDSVLSRIVQLVNDAQKKKSSSERFVDRFSHVYTPVMVAGSVLLGIASLILGISLQGSIYRGLTLLVISCPCAFAISIPVSMVSALVGSARDGVLVKGAAFLEKMSDVRTVAFDKTGTLTSGDFVLENVCLHDDATEEEILEAAVSLEGMSEHPIAQALVRATEGMPRETANEFVSIPGRGVKGKINGDTYTVGSRRLLDEQSVELVDNGHSCGIGTAVYVAKNSKHLGTIVLADVTRKGSKETIAELRRRGLRTVMLTGDNEAVAQKLAEELGFDEYHAGLLPEQKVRIIRDLAKKGTVIMVGDGVNDAPALAAAHVGIALGVVSSDVALETADVALMKDDLTKIPTLLSRAKQTMRIVRQNVTASITLKLLLGVLAVFGLVSLWLAIAVGDMGLSLAVISNALRLTRRGAF